MLLNNKNLGSIKYTATVYFTVAVNLTLSGSFILFSNAIMLYYIFNICLINLTILNLYYQG